MLKLTFPVDKNNLNFLDEPKVKVDPLEILESNSVMMDSKHILKVNPMKSIKIEYENSTMNKHTTSEYIDRLEKSCGHHEISEIAAKLNVSPKVLLTKRIKSHLFYGPCEFCNENWNLIFEIPNFQPEINKSPTKSEPYFSNLIQSRVRFALENKTVDYLTEQKYKFSEMDKIIKTIYSKKGLRYIKYNQNFPEEIKIHIKQANEEFFNVLLQDILGMTGISRSKIVTEEMMVPKKEFHTKNLIKCLIFTCGRHELNQVSMLWGIPINELLATIESENIVFPKQTIFPKWSKGQFRSRCRICKIILDQPLFPEDKPLQSLNNARLSISKYKMAIFRYAQTSI